ncbi:MAG: hypothetical protein COX90_00525 [Candidatus Nealsonbacteria bacterium CG_4_10_14_0_2_um_filter_38_17]|uniref:Uncharacterized protein n=2 Tax=Candidatus Nealsoniibacteriota TaxID=1817911 RepID=A0A2M7UZ22_9BACT|nr:MAG: hypothetical protein COX36_03395 [Candidatus Nealsonbacteria bacterium CG23_combo_of_CG06-09_8_20_14_all_38_19]PIZ89219.1 MAG: hypothetical protein COX90_00525 [Candidatus Nealsonbacteria bacterium CG_4_10_14_0_2_um_filter_38_17]
MANGTNGDLPELTLEEIKTAEEEGGETVAKVGRIRTWVTTQLPILEQARNLPPEQLWPIAEKVQAVQSRLHELLSDEDPVVRRAALLPFLKHQFSSAQLTSRQAVDDLFNGLVRSGFLDDSPWGDQELRGLTVYNQALAVSLPEGLMSDSDYAELQDTVDLLLQRVDRSVKEAQREKANGLKFVGNPDLDQLLAGKPGRYVLSVPPDPPTNGRDFWLGGGTLLVESDGQKIRPVNAAGSIEAGVEEARRLKVHLLLYTLSPTWTKAPVVNSLGEDMGRKVQLLWYLIKRAIRTKEEAKAVEAERQAMAEKTDLLPGQFFMERKTGTCMVDFDGVWKHPSVDPIYNLFLLVCREEKENGKFIRIVEVPKRLEEFFARSMGQEFPEEDDRFNGCAQPLKAVLQAVWKQTKQTAITQ